MKLSFRCDKCVRVWGGEGGLASRHKGRVKKNKNKMEDKCRIIKLEFREEIAPPEPFVFLQGGWKESQTAEERER